MPDGSLHAGGLVKSISIDNLLVQCDTILKQVGAAIEMLREAERSAGVSGICRDYRAFPWMLAGPEYSRRNDLLDEGTLAGIRQRIHAAGWNHLLHESGLRTFMDAKMRQEWADKIEKCNVPALTRENIESTFGALYDSRQELFERGVIRCFKALSWSYKTNSPVKFGKRIVVTYLSGYNSFRTERLDELADLQRVFCILDGKPEEDHRSGLSSRLNSAKTATDETGAPRSFVYKSRGDHDDIYLSLRWFKNGNGHITFKRPDLVHMLNQILIKHHPDALPEPQD